MANVFPATPEDYEAFSGSSAANLRYMRALAEAYPDSEFVQQVVALLPWGHNVRLLDTVKDPEELAWLSPADCPERLEPQCADPPVLKVDFTAAD